MHGEKTALLDEVAGYYSRKLALHGETPNGVDWNGEQGQVLRFAQLCKVIADEQPFSIADLGCGYGALVDYLKGRYTEFGYIGIDVSSEMVRAAEQRHRDVPGVRFIAANTPDMAVDYSVASGIFNVRMGRSDIEWQGGGKN